MTCPHADCPIPEVRVPSGTNLRCGCGKTVVPMPPPPPVSPTANLEALLAVLRANRVQQYQAAGVMIVLHPDSWTSAPERPSTVSTTADPIPEEPCSCGHDLNEHTQAGCVNGCEIDKCGRAEEKAA